MLKSVVLTRPISNYMDHLSFLETVRIRTRLRLQGILSNSQCKMLPDEFILANMRMITGDCGLETIHDYFNILQSPEDLQWSTDFALNPNECLPIVLTAMCDAWRRLVLPFSGMPWKLFRLADMSDEDGLRFLHSSGLEAGSCQKCQDPFFTLVLPAESSNIVFMGSFEMIDT